MANALIITEDAAEAFHSYQILTELFSRVKVCNRMRVAKELFISFKPDLVIASDLTTGGLSAAAVLLGISSQPTASVILCSGLESVAGPDPFRSVRIVRPLTSSSVFEALESLSLTGIVNQTSLQLSIRSPAND